MFRWRVPDVRQVSALPAEEQELALAYLRRVCPPHPVAPWPPPGRLHCGCPAEAALKDEAGVSVCADCSGIPRPG